MDYKKLKRQILIELRGPLTQLQFSQKLGYSFNQVGKWESSATRMKWTEFYDVCAASGFLLEKPMLEVFLCLNKDVRDSMNALVAIRVFHGSYSFDTLSQMLHSHTSVIRRWFRGDVCPDIESVLALMDLRKGFLSLFISKIVNLDNISIISELAQTEAVNRSMDAMDPDMTVIKLCLRLSEYKNLPSHSDDFIYEHSNLTIPEIQRRIKILIDSDQISWENNKLINKIDTLRNLTGDTENFIKLQKHWVEKMLMRFNTPSGIPTKKNMDLPSYQSCFVFTASKKEMFQIYNLLNKCFEEIRQLSVSSLDSVDDSLDNKEDEIRVLMMSFFCPNDIPQQQQQQN